MKKQSETFEASMIRLEEIVRKLEQGDAPLDESLKLFEEGTGLVARCNKLLDEAELTVSKVTQGENGQPEVTLFEGEEA